MWSTWFRFFLIFSNSPVFFTSFIKPFQAYQLQIVSQSPSCHKSFLARFQSSCICLSFCFICNFIPLKVFHSTVSWRSFTGAWVKASLLKSIGLFSVFLSVLIIQSSGLSPLVLHLFSSPFTNPLVTLQITPITTAITVTFMFHSSLFFVHQQSLDTLLSF